MSHYSGRFDVCDYIAGTGGWFDKDGNLVKFGDKNVHVYYSDEYLDFLAFKKATDGKLYQYQKVVVTEYNQKEVAEKLPGIFEIIEHKDIIEDKRVKSGKKEKITYTYKYYNRECTLKELNKQGVYITVEVPFNTLLDLIQYYPYIVISSVHVDGKQKVYISKQSAVDTERESHYECGLFSDMWVHYKEKLAEHYQEVVLRYFNPAGKEHVETIKFENIDGKYIGKTSKAIDENFKVSWSWPDKQIKTHWCSPTVIDHANGIIEMNKNDYKSYLGDTMNVYYVEAKEYERHLN